MTCLGRWLRARHLSVDGSLASVVGSRSELEQGTSRANRRWLRRVWGGVCDLRQPTPGFLCINKEPVCKAV